MIIKVSNSNKKIKYIYFLFVQCGTKKAMMLLREFMLFKKLFYLYYITDSYQ